MRRYPINTSAAETLGGYRSAHTAVSVLLAATGLLVGGQAAALDTIPQESGLSGFVSLGADVRNVKNNMIVGTSLKTVTKNSIDSITASPNDRITASPIFNYDLRYTFASTRTQILLGQEILDALRFEGSSGIGVAQELSDQSVVTAKYLFTSLPTKVWADPYIANRGRNNTDRKANGVQLSWSGILGTNLTARFTYRDISIDDEDSGKDLGLAANQRKLLKRKGDTYDYSIRYAFDLGGGNFLEPQLSYTDNDLEGRAMQNRQYSAQLNYLYHGSGFDLVANALLARASYETTNPIYNKTREDDIYGLGATYFYHRPFGFKDWSAVARLGWYKGDSNINFYNSSLLTTSLSALYRF